MTHEGQCKEKKREEVDAPTIPNDTKPTESACSEQQPQKPASNHVVLPTWFQNEDCQAVSSVMNHHQEPCLERNNPAKRVRLARGKFQCEFCKTVSRAMNATNKQCASSRCFRFRSLVFPSCSYLQWPQKSVLGAKQPRETVRKCSRPQRWRTTPHSSSAEPAETGSYWNCRFDRPNSRLTYL